MADNYITNYNGSITALSDNIDVNGKSIQGAEVSIRTNASNGDVIIDANGTGNIVIDGLRYPNTDGNPNEVLITDGSGNLRFAPQAAGGGGGSSYYWNIAADDSTTLRVLSDNTIKFIGGDGLTTASDSQGNITYNQVSRNFSITGEATASDVAYNGTGDIALSVTLDHNALDDQYIRLDGTTQPSASLNFNAQDITNAGAITATSFTGPLTGSVTGNVTGDIKGSVVADDSTIIVDAVAGGVPFTRILSTPTTVAGYGITDALALSSLSVGADASASGSGGIAFNDGTGVFTFTPPDLSPYLTTETDTLDNVTGRGATTTNDITVGTITTTGTNAITTSDLIIAGGTIRTVNSNSNIEFDPAGTGIVNILSGVNVSADANVTLGTGNTLTGNSSGTMKLTSTTEVTTAADIIYLNNSADSETMADFTANGAVQLYYDNSVRLATSSAGVSITGTLDSDTNIEATGSFKSGNLTSGRVLYAGTAGLIQDSSKLTFDGSVLDLNGTIDGTVLRTEGIQITQNNISGTRSNENITVTANGTGKVEIADPLFTGATLETTVGSDGGASGLPATPERYLKISVNGTEYKIPLYLIT